MARCYADLRRKGEALGLFGDLKKIVLGGKGAVEDVVTGVESIFTGPPQVPFEKAQAFLGHTKDFLQGLMGLGVDLGRTGEKYLENIFVKKAGSPILAAAQAAISTMKLTTGSGPPEDGEEFKKSAKLFEEAVEIFIDARPQPDRWDGTAANAYAKADHEQQTRASLMDAADEQMQAVLSKEAAEIGGTRKTLDDWSQYLYDFGMATYVLDLAGPEGAAVREGLELAAAALALGVCTTSIAQMAGRAFDNAAKVRQQTDRYHEATADVQKGSACDPFGYERDRLPTRLNPPVPNQPPKPEKPPVWGPPARPEGAPNPTPSPGTPHPAVRRPAAPSPAVPAPSAPAAVSSPAGQPAAGSSPAAPPIAPAASAPAPAVSPPAAQPSAVPAPAVSPVGSATSAPSPVTRVAPAATPAGPSLATGGTATSLAAPAPVGPQSAAAAATAGSDVRAQPGGQIVEGAQPGKSNTQRPPINFGVDADPDPASAQLNAVNT